MMKRSLFGACALSSVAFLLSPTTGCGSSGGSPAQSNDGGVGAGSSGSVGSSSGTISGSGSGTVGSSSGTTSGSSSGTGTGSGSGTTTGSSSGTSTGSSSGAPPDGDGGTGGAESVLQLGKNVYHSQTFAESGLTKAAVVNMAPDTTFNTNATFPANGVATQNAGTGSVLYLEQGPAAAGCPTGATACTATGRAAGAGLFFAFPGMGSNPNVVAFDETSGQTVWTAHLTTGGDGIRGTAVIDSASRRLFVVTGNSPHLVHALAVDTGVEATTGGWPVTLSSSLKYSGNGPDGTAYTQTFPSQFQNQHGALLLTNNVLYIPFGGEYGDGNAYFGWVVAVDITNPTNIGSWASVSPKTGIWGAGGLASDGTSVFAVTGNSSATTRASSDSEEVVRLTGLATLTRNEANVYVPKAWQTWDGNDRDFGASTPAFVPLPAGSNPPSLLIAPAKLGQLFILNGADLSAGSYVAPNYTGGELADLEVSDEASESVYTSPTIYTSASGLHATINVGNKPMNCPMGTSTTVTNSKEAVVSVLIKPGSTPIATPAWCAANTGTAGDHLNSPPISTTSDGVSADAMVWFINGSQLEVVDGDTGDPIFTTTGAACDTVPSMSWPIAVKNRIVVAALGHLCSWSVNGQ